MDLSSYMTMRSGPAATAIVLCIKQTRHGQHVVTNCSADDSQQLAGTAHVCGQAVPAEERGLGGHAILRTQVVGAAWVQSEKTEPHRAK